AAGGRKDVVLFIDEPHRKDGARAEDSASLEEALELTIDLGTNRKELRERRARIARRLERQRAVEDRWIEEQFVRHIVKGRLVVELGLAEDGPEETADSPRGPSRQDRRAESCIRMPRNTVDEGTEPRLGDLLEPLRKGGTSLGVGNRFVDERPGQPGE